VEHTQCKLNAQLRSLEFNVGDIASERLWQAKVVYAGFCVCAKSVGDQVINRGQLRDAIRNRRQVIVQDAHHMGRGGLVEDVLRKPKTFTLLDLA
jgi:hypothetical protein